MCIRDSIKELGGPEEDPSFTQRRRDELLTRFRADDDPYVSYCGCLLYTSVLA